MELSLHVPQAGMPALSLSSVPGRPPGPHSLPAAIGGPQAIDPLTGLASFIHRVECVATSLSLSPPSPQGWAWACSLPFCAQQLSVLSDPSPGPALGPHPRLASGLGRHVGCVCVCV